MAAPSSKSKPYVVIADNISEKRILVCNLVEELNCVAIPITSSSEIFNAIRGEHVGLVLLDLDFDLSQARKQNTLGEIKKISPLMPVVIMGHVMTPVLFRRLSDRGAQSFLQKPVGRNELAMALYRNLW